MRKVKKTKKAKKMRGRGMGTHGWGARKKHRETGHRGGKGMSGSGKRADHKKTLVTKLFGGNYFGKKGVTSRGTKQDKTETINLQSIEMNLVNFVKKGIAKKTKDGFEIDLKKCKILGTGDVKNKLFIKSKSASKSAIEKVKKAGGEISVSKVQEKRDVSEKS